MEAQNASVVCPDNKRPLASVMVPEMIMGSSVPDSSNILSAANIAAFELRTSAYHPQEEHYLANLRASVEYWRQWIKE